jgi:Amt family ammonium transporter
MLIGIQLLGVVSVFAWTFAVCLVLFTVIKKTIGLRVKPEEELRGLDIGEHGIESYSGFQVFTTQ